ncbi:MAG: alpha-1,2-fucosyltransferase, partial [Betaproteobacteria bacterium]|nr:alpha-1,2-fucosyltransferase [Betaproteobacteria bacterium]
YAAARRLAWANDAELVLDAGTGFKYDHLYRRTYSLGCFNIPARLATPAEQMEPFGRIRRFLVRKLSERKPLAQRRYIQQVGVEFDPGIVTLRLMDGTTYFDPFGQSEGYFADIRDELKKDLVMSEPSEPESRAMAARIASTDSVALHVRWFETGDSANSSNMSRAYYAAVIPHLLAKIPGAHFFVFSDRPKETAELLSPLMGAQPFTWVQHNAKTGNAEADFWLMRQCRHFIIGNSTFAWWAAWLGEQEREGALVFAPARFIDPHANVTSWGFPGLLPERWTVL